MADWPCCVPGTLNQATLYNLRPDRFSKPVRSLPLQPFSLIIKMCLMKTFTTVPGHFDGKEIKLDVPVDLEPNARLLITILDSSEVAHQRLVEAAMSASESSFTRLWDNDEDAVYDSL